MIIYDGERWRPFFTKAYIQFTGSPLECAFMWGYAPRSLEDTSKVLEYMKYLKRKRVDEYRSLFWNIF